MSLSTDIDNLHESEKLNLLRTIVRTVEYILSPRPVTIWHVLPGAIQKVYSAILNILKHGFISRTENGNTSSDLWGFVFGLRVLKPDIWPTLEMKRVEEIQDSEQKFSHWLQVSLQTLALKEQIQTLLQDEERIKQFYDDWSFLLDRNFYQAFLISLQALENNSQDTLAKIDPSLMVRCHSKHPTSAPPQHLEVPLDDMDCSLLPSLSVSPSCLEIDYASTPAASSDKERGVRVQEEEETRKPKLRRRNTPLAPATPHHKPIEGEEALVYPSSFLLQYVASKPGIAHRKNKDLPSPQQEQPPPPPMPKKPPKHVRSYSDGAKIVLPPREALPPPSRKTSLLCRPSFLEDGGHSIAPEADGFFPTPQPGQNLLDFLATSHLSQSGAQLDRENAHFSVAEAVLAAIEQMSFDSQRPQRAPTAHPDESEDDILLHRNKGRRRPKLRSRSTVFKNTSDDEPATTDYSMIESPESSSEETDFSEQNAESCGLSPGDPSSDPYSAENIAITILMQYNTQLIPQADQLQWLVTEQDAPQKLLPMPTSVAVSPDDPPEGHYFTPLLRGTSDWAPPRPQIILTLHPHFKRSNQLVTQKYRCAGCGSKVSEKLSRHFRLCHYLGRLFCTVCHNNKKASIPAKVIHKWDFKKYEVSNFAHELLSRMSSSPLFNVGALNPRLYSMCRDLHQTHIYRLQLFHARVYVNTCSRANKEKKLLAEVANHWWTEPQLYSMEDLLAVKGRTLILHMKQLTTSCVQHISSCKVCLGRGFICELCSGGGPIFPFQLDAVAQCSTCRQCFHLVCFSPVNRCPRCLRRERRQAAQDDAL